MMQKTTTDSTRRAFLKAGGFGMAASLVSPRGAEGAPRTPAEEANVKIS
jgi:hypothetical protein